MAWAPLLQHPHDTPNACMHACVQESESVDVVRQEFFTTAVYLNHMARMAMAGLLAVSTTGGAGARYPPGWLNMMSSLSRLPPAPHPHNPSDNRQGRHHALDTLVQSRAGVQGLHTWIDPGAAASTTGRLSLIHI